MSIFAELKRRNVFKVAAAYIIVSWLIMQAGDTLAPALHLPEWVNSLLAFFLILGFPLALFFAWAFEMTPEGIKKEKDVDRSKSITSVTGQKLNNAIIGVLVLALAYFAIDKFILTPGRDLPGTDHFSQQIASQATDVGEKSALSPIEANKETIQSIAVLPFVDMSANNDNEYFSDGLTEELLNILANIKELQVAGRTSSFAFKGKDEDLRSIGEKLNVVSILEGSVRKDDKRNRVRITAQLVNVADGYHLWSETYDRDLDDIFAIQGEIAHEVARALRITLLGEDDARLEQVKSTEIGAYDFYLKGLQDLNQGGFVSLDSAVTQFQQVLSLDPAYTPAKVGLVNAWNAMANTGAISRQQALSRGLPLLEQVLAEQPRNSAARVQMANLRVHEGNNEAAEKEYIAALVDNPRNAIGLKQYGRFLFNNGQVEKGMDLIQAALEIDPYSTQVLWEQCQTNAYLQRVEISLAACELIREIEPESPQGWYGWAVAHNFSGDLARGLRGFSEAIKRDPGDFEMLAGVAQLWLMMGDAEQARQWLTRAEAIGAGQPVPTISRLMLLKYREQHDLARDLAEKTLALNADDRFGSQYMLRQLWAFELARAGDYQTALTPFRQALPWAFEAELVLPQDVENQLGDMIQIAALLKLADPTSQRPAQLLEVVEGLNGKQHPGWGIWASDLTSAYIAAIRGESEAALQSLNNAWDKQWRLGWRRVLLEDAVMTQLRNEPGFQELVARFEADMERQRLLAYELMEIIK
jgi:TolB-like protein/tetratricopeptide (TPR) repeat protein